MRKIRIGTALLLCVLLLTAAAAVLQDDNLRLRLRENIRYPELAGEAVRGKWYSLSPADARCADGSAWKGRIRFGDEKKLIVYFLGGGLALDEYSAQRPYSTAGANAFYYDGDLGVSSRRIGAGLASDAPENPFSDWTLLMIPYATGDFHVGTEGVHRGYRNFQALLTLAQTYIGAPERLLIAGYSAGGFGAAMLADEVISYFPCDNTTLLVDSALLINQNWKDVVKNRWKAPEVIVERTRTDNLTWDHLLALHQAHPQVKLLFASTLRDGSLAKFQSYIDGGAYQTTDLGGESYCQSLRKMLAQAAEALPEMALYLWDDQPSGGASGHAMLYSDAFFTTKWNESSMAEWVYAATQGELTSCGLNILQSLQSLDYSIEH